MCPLNFPLDVLNGKKKARLELVQLREKIASECARINSLWLS